MLFLSILRARVGVYFQFIITRLLFNYREGGIERETIISFFLKRYVS